MKYQKRITDEQINHKMQLTGAVLVEGCKWCGKTTSAEQIANSEVKLQDPDQQSVYENIKNTKPSLFLEGEKPRLFDEWQRFPVIWDSVRTNVDKTGKKGQYLLTGSARPADDVVMHSGTGRISRVVMRTMSLYESGDSDGRVSFKDIITGKDIAAANSATIEDYAAWIERGGWPSIFSTKKSLQKDIAPEYFDFLLREEVQSIDGPERNYHKMRIVLESLARNISTPVSNTTIEKDTKSNFEPGVSRVTIADYLDTLRKLFVIYDIPATNLKFRSKTAIRTTPKMEFTDPSVAMAALKMSAGDLIHDLNTFGFMFENLALRDLIIYSQQNGENLYYYRDAEGFEVDAILHTTDGKFGAIEIKLGSGEIDKAAENLLKFAQKSVKKPAFLMVITGSGYSFKRPDGVYVVSLASLKD